MHIRVTPSCVESPYSRRKASISTFTDPVRAHPLDQLACRRGDLLPCFGRDLKPIEQRLHPRGLVGAERSPDRGSQRCRRGYR